MAGVSPVADVEVVPTSSELSVAVDDAAAATGASVVFAEVGEPEMSSGQVDLTPTTSCT